ncbi:MAG: radical SAM protein [Planctomycetaceae bacterium]|nr:radical SAM protein [Planctomycetaceae bacterium]
MTSIKPISLYDTPSIDEVRAAARFDPQVIRSLHSKLLRRFDPDDVALVGFPLGDQLRLHALEFYRRYDSAVDGATKLLLRTSAGMLIESVILRVESGRSTLCVSSQIGCAAACEFCASGKMGIARDLSADEIVDQVLQAGQLLVTEGRQLRNIVFMGMGEPFHNEENLFAALELLIAPEFFNHSPGKVLVSTVGVTDGMLRCAARFPAVNLALSLHSVRQRVRERLIPLAKKYPLDDLHRTIAEVNQLQATTTVMIEYLMLAGVNDGRADATDLIEWLDGLSVHVNLIPYNPITDAPHFVGSDRPTCRAFAQQLRTAGLKTTVRYSLGNDIAAGCGQLVRQENRMIARQTLVDDG